MKTISNRQLERFPIYLKYLLSIRDSDLVDISAPSIGKALGFSSEQVRKDLQVVAKSEGKPNRGRDINGLIKDIQSFLGYDVVDNAIIIGVGHLGKAFMNYAGFKEFGLNIIAGFDIDKSLIGQKINDKPIYDLTNLEEIMEYMNVKVAIISVPSSSAQDVVNRVVNIGIKGIWNFVPTHIAVPEDVVIENVNLASSLAVLSHKLRSK